MRSETITNVHSLHERERETLKRKVQRALSQAKMRGERVGGPLPEDDEVIELDWIEARNCVFVSNSHDYLVLLNLVLEELVRLRYGLDDEALASYRIENSDWFDQYIEYAMEHELQHLNGALEHTDLKTRLGVQFVVLEDGILIYYPRLDVKGKVTWGVYREAVLSAPRLLSKGDKLELGQEL